MTKTLSVKIADDLYKKLKYRASRQYLEIDELIEDIIRRSMLSYKKNSNPISSKKMDDSLIPIFSREKRGKQKKNTAREYSLRKQ